MMNGPALRDNDVLDSGLFTIILRASGSYGASPYWAAVITFDDQPNSTQTVIRQMAGMGRSEGKFFYTKRISRDGVNILWADALRCFKMDVEEDYCRVLQSAERAGLAPPPPAQLVTRGVMTCRDWIVHLVTQKYLSPYAMVWPLVVDEEFGEEGAVFQQEEVDGVMMALGVALFRIVQMVEYNGAW